MQSDAARESEVIREVLIPVAPQPDLLLPTLLEWQRRLGHISNACIAAAAQHFNLSRADVYGVASFYHDLRLEAAGDHQVQICQAEACQAVGCRALAAHAERRLGVTIGTTSPDRRITLEAAYCFGNCACGPTVRIGDAIHGRVTPERFDALVAAALGAVALDAVALGAVAPGAVAPGAVALDAVALDAVALDAVALDAVALDAVALGAVVLPERQA